MFNPNFDIKLSVSAFFFFAGVILSYASHVGWVAISGLLYYVAAQKLGVWFTISTFVLSIIFFTVGIWRIGWVF